jgi:hypothetical protein
MIRAAADGSTTLEGGRMLHMVQPDDVACNPAVSANVVDVAASLN